MSSSAQKRAPGPLSAAWMRSGRCSLGISIWLRWLASVRQQQLVRLLSQLGDVALGQQRSTAVVRASGGVQTHSLLLEVQQVNSTAYQPRLLNCILTYQICCLCSPIKHKLYTCVLLRSLKGPQIIQIIVKSFKWDQKDVNLFLKRRASAKCHAAVQGRRRQICSKKCNWIFIIRPLQKGLQYF